MSLVDPIFTKIPINVDFMMHVSSFSAFCYQHVVFLLVHFGLHGPFGYDIKDSVQDKEESIYQMVLSLGGGIQIFVWTLAGKTIVLAVFGAPSTLQLVLHIIIITDIMQTFVKILDGKTISLDIEAPDMIYSVKANFQCKDGIQPDQQRLDLADMLLEDGRTFSVYYKHIEKEFIHWLVLSLGGGMQIAIKTITLIDIVKAVCSGIQIFVKILDGKTISLDIEAPDMIYSVKANFQGKDGIQPDQQRLDLADIEAPDIEANFQGKDGIQPDQQRLVLADMLLEDGRTFPRYDNHIEKESIHQLVLSLGGGIQIAIKDNEDIPPDLQRMLVFVRTLTGIENHLDVEEPTLHLALRFHGDAEALDTVDSARAKFKTMRTSRQIIIACLSS